MSRIIFQFPSGKGQRLRECSICPYFKILVQTIWIPSHIRLPMCVEIQFSDSAFPYNSNFICNGFIHIHIEMIHMVPTTTHSRGQFRQEIRIRDSVIIQVNPTSAPFSGFENIFTDNPVHRGGGGISHPIVDLLLTGTKRQESRKNIFNSFHISRFHSQWMSSRRRSRCRRRSHSSDKACRRRKSDRQGQNSQTTRR